MRKISWGISKGITVVVSGNYFRRIFRLAYQIRVKGILGRSSGETHWGIPEGTPDEISVLSFSRISVGIPAEITKTYNLEWTSGGISWDILVGMFNRTL